MRLAPQLGQKSRCHQQQDDNLSEDIYENTGVGVHRVIELTAILTVSGVRAAP